METIEVPEEEGDADKIKPEVVNTTREADIITEGVDQTIEEVFIIITMGIINSKINLRDKHLEQALALQITKLFYADISNYVSSKTRFLKFLLFRWTL